MSDQTPLIIRKVRTARGLVWVSGSWELVKRQPLRLLMISLFFLLLSQFFLNFLQSSMLRLLVVICLPVLTAGLLQAFLIVERGEKPMLAVLFMPFTARGSLGRLLSLGGIVLVLTLLIVSLVLAGQVVDIDPEVIKRIEQGDLDALQFIDPKIMENAVFAMAVGAAISGSISYFAVPLIWFKNQATGGALLMGLKGLGRNWRPLLLLGVLLVLLALPIVVLLASFYLTALSGGPASSWLAFLLLILGASYQLLLFGTQYLAFRDIFGLEKHSSESADNTGDQLVA